MTQRINGLLRSIFETYVYSSLHIGLCAISLTIFGFIVIDLPIFWNYVLAVGAGTVVIYNAHRLIGIKRMTDHDNGRYLVLKRQYPYIVAFTLLFGVTSCYFLTILPFKVVLLMVAGILPTLVYILPILNGRRGRDFGEIKIIVVALVWTYLCISIPSILKGDMTGISIIVQLAVLFFFIAITLPFDARDFYIDNALDVKTIPSYLGIRRTLIAGQVIVLCSGILAWLYLILFYPDSDIGWVLLIVHIVSFIFIYNWSPKKNDLYLSFWMDGLIALYLGIYFLVSN